MITESVDQEVSFADSDVDEDEIVQDWSQIATLIGKNQPLLPRRGEKDYEPDGTDIQELMLYRAKKCMFDTLHQSVRGTVVKNQVKAFYCIHTHKATVSNPKGTFTNSMGIPNPDGSLCLKFLEFVYLAERGTITPFVKFDSTDDQKTIPLSMEDIYSLFRSSEEFDEFLVYSYLKRMGFIVISKDSPYGSHASFFGSIPPENLNRKSIFDKIWNRNPIFCLPWFRFLLHPMSLIFKKHTTMTEIYESISCQIPYYSPPKTIEQLRMMHLTNTENKEANYKISFNIWKPAPNFKKSSPGLPDFQVVIHNKNYREKGFPNLQDFKDIFQKLDYKFSFLTEIDVTDEDALNQVTFTNNIPTKEFQMRKLNIKRKECKKENNKKPKKKKGSKKSPSSHAQQMKRLRQGYRSFLLAIMDDGLISFAKVTEADFGSERVWYVPDNKNNTSSRSTKVPRHKVK